MKLYVKSLSYILVGNALMDLGDMDKALHHHEKDLELAKKG